MEIKKGKIEKKEILFGIIMLLYPLRHINIGLDLWDTGYNYANFTYMGFEHMDSMWLFSTYLANFVGHIITHLPGADNLIGMNLYTGLFVSFLAIAGYYFITRILHASKWIAFVGEFVAISLCWCPTALLYNYLTYVLFLLSIINLFIGLYNEKRQSLFIAGFFLGTNILVRFSNLPQAAMILVVWVYDFIVWYKRKKSGIELLREAKLWHVYLRHTAWCLSGYLSALTIMAFYIQMRYGLDSYIKGICRLFSMTDSATDYKPVAMIMGIIGTYVENLYWVFRIMIIVAVGIIICSAMEYICKNVLFVQKSKILCKTIQYGNKAIAMLIAIVMVIWLYKRGFCSLQFYSYGSMLRPAILFMMLSMVIAAGKIIYPKTKDKEILISLIVILVILLTSIGSNNGVYPSINNLFIVAPYTFWECWKFTKNAGNILIKKIVIIIYPVKYIMLAFLLLFMVQTTVFGMKFVFAEATGVQDISATVENNEVLKGVRMSSDKAKWISELSEYVNENHLQEKKLILYGNIPAVSYYLKMPAAFNPWIDLRSYNIEQMKLDMQKLEKETVSKEKLPIIILEHKQIASLEDGIEDNEKWMLLNDFIERHAYEIGFKNEKFVLLKVN